MELNIQDWKEFKLSDYFDVTGTTTTKLDTLIENYGLGHYPYVTTQATNNGVAGYYNCYTEEGNILVADSAVAGYVSYQPYNFSASDHVEKLIPKFYFNKYIAMFLVTVLNREGYRYSYGRKFNQDNIRNTIIKLPAKQMLDNSFIPDWQFMEDYIKSLHHKPITTNINADNIPELNIRSWEWFSLGRLFDIRKGKRLTSADQEEGYNNYVGAIDSNNGIANHIGQAPIHEANTISLSYNGSVGEAFYQSEPYWATDDVNALYSRYKDFNAQIGLFIATVIRQEKYKFSYGRKWTLENMNSTNIKLPIKRNNNGNPIIDDNCTYSDKGYIPDWQFMEDYINSLPYSDRI